MQEAIRAKERLLLPPGSDVELMVTWRHSSSQELHPTPTKPLRGQVCVSFSHQWEKEGGAAFLLPLVGEGYGGLAACCLAVVG